MQDWAETVEAAADTIRWFEPLIIPGLLQTEDYMRAIFTTPFGITSEEIEQRVAARLKRQEVLSRDKAPALWAIVDEGALRRPIGGRHVMREQLNRLIEAARQPRIQIEVVPVSTGVHEGLNGSFIIADFDAAPSVTCIQGALGTQVYRERKDVAYLDLTWSTLRGEALPRSASLALLEEAAKSWSSAT